MNNNDIHKEFSQAEVRDLIAKGIIKTYERESSVYSYCEETRLEQAKEKLRIAQQNYEALKEQEAWGTIMNILSWEEFDVSDETVLNHNTKWYLSFIGTEAEYKILINKIEQENG